MAQKGGRMALSQIKKFEDLSFGQWVAVGNKIGGLDKVIELLQGRFTVELKEPSGVLFDKHGRRISDGFISCNPATSCTTYRANVNHPSFLDSAMIDLHVSLSQINVDIPRFLSTEYFRTEIDRLIDLITNNPKVANITNGTWLPLILPRFHRDNVGSVLNDYISIIYGKHDNPFDIDEKVKAIINGVDIVRGSRQSCLIKKMRSGFSVGIFFPYALWGFSIDASRKQMASLPEGFVLSGIDSIIAMITYRHILAHDDNPVALNLSALSFQSQTLYFITNKSEFYLNLYLKLHQKHNLPFNNLSSGLLFIG